MQYEIDDKLDDIYKIHETYDPYMIAKDKEINLIEVPLDTDTCGFTVRNNRSIAIILNSLLHENLKEFVLCHELGHVFLHKNVNTPFMRAVGAPSQVLKIEAQANQFSFKLLARHYEELLEMSKEDILNYFGLPSWMERYICYDI